MVCVAAPFCFIGNTVIHSCVKVEPSYEIKNAPRGNFVLLYKNY